jgi:hypothetical protein
LFGDESSFLTSRKDINERVRVDGKFEVFYGQGDSYQDAIYSMQNKNREL